LKTLYLLRHAKAESTARQGDVARPLAKRGHKAAAAMGDFLATLAPPAELVLCSPAARTRETLEWVGSGIKPAPRIVFDERLYLADARVMRDVLRELPENVGTVLLVGHNPGMHELAARLVKDSTSLADGFPTAALAMIEIPDPWQRLPWRESKLVLYRTPKDISRDLDDADR
jgi:phosphohistidine phosphatase